MGLNPRPVRLGIERGARGAGRRRRLRPGGRSRLDRRLGLGFGPRVQCADRDRRFDRRNHGHRLDWLNGRGRLDGRDRLLGNGLGHRRILDRHLAERRDGGERLRRTLNDVFRMRGFDRGLEHLGRGCRLVRHDHRLGRQRRRRGHGDARRGGRRQIERRGDGVHPRLRPLGADLALALAIGPAEHAEADFALAHDHFLGAEVVEVGHLLVGMGAGDDLQRRVELVRLLDRLPGLEGIGDGDEQRPGGRDVGQRQRFAAGGVADDHLDAGGMSGSDPLLRILDEHERRALPLEPVGHNGADAAIADQHRMMGESRRRSLVDGLDRRRGRPAPR